MKNLKTDLKKVTIADVANVVTGKTPPTSRSEYYGGPFLFVAPGDLGRHKYVRHSEKTLTAEGIHHTPSIPKGSILFTCIGSTIGKIGIAGENLSTNQQINSVIPKDVDPEYLYYILDRLGKRIKRNAGVQAIPIVTKSEFESQHLLIHHDAETQKRISDLLSVWDIAIEKIEALIAAKEHHLEWLVTKLISKSSHKKRPLSNFIEEISKRNRKNEVNLVLSVTNHSGFILPEEQFERRVASPYVTNYKIVQRGQYAYNPSRINVGSIARLDAWEDAILSPMYTVFSLDENVANSDYFLHWLSSSEARQRIKKCAQGSVRETVSFGDLGVIPIRLPDLDIQKKLADTLNTARHELSRITDIPDFQFMQTPPPL